MMVLDPVPYRLLISALLLIIMLILRYFQVVADSATESRMQQIPDKESKYDSKIEWICKKKKDIHSTFQFINLVVTALIVMTAWSYAEGFQSYLARFLTMAIFVASMLVFGIYIPTRIAKNSPEMPAVNSYSLYRVLVVLFFPVIVFFDAVSNLVLKLFRVKLDSAEAVTEEDILMMIDIGSTSGAIDPDEKEMITNIFEFDDTPAKDIMTHRTDVDFLWIEDDIEEWSKEISETNHSVYPVCDESVDNIIGIVSSKDFYRMMCTENRDVKKIMRSPYFVPESIKADDLFRHMQKNKSHFAVVLDEYGGLGGIITISDLLEEIVGSFSDVDEVIEDDIITIDENTWQVLGGCDIDTVAEELDVELPIEEYNTFGGMILGELGAIPDDGSTPSLEAYGLSIKVLKIEDHRIEKAVVTKIEPAPETDSDE